MKALRRDSGSGRAVELARRTSLILASAWASLAIVACGAPSEEQQLFPFPADGQPVVPTVLTPVGGAPTVTPSAGAPTSTSPSATGPVASTPVASAPVASATGGSPVITGTDVAGGNPGGVSTPVITATSGSTTPVGQPGGVVTPPPPVVIDTTPRLTPGNGSCLNSLPSYNGNGSVTFYTFEMGTVAAGGPNCSFGFSANPDTVQGITTGGGRLFGAMNSADYAGSATCGACAEVTRDGSRSVVVTIVDQCPLQGNAPCQRSGHIDLSREAFLQLGSEQEGYLGVGGVGGSISWRYVPCPSGEEVTFRLKEGGDNGLPANVYWNQVVVEGHVLPIASVDVNIGGTWVPTVRREFNFWEPPARADMGPIFGTVPYRVRATDINGSTIEASIELAPGRQQAGGLQYPVCQ